MQVEARLLDRATGLEAEWGATGQILLPAAPPESAAAHWRGARTLATSSSRQSVVLPPGGRATIRVGREIPFAGWLLLFGKRCDRLEPEAEWREVESSLEVEALDSSADGTVRLALTPEFAYLQGRARRSVSYPDQRVEIAVPDGGEARFVPAAGQEEFYKHFLSGYDALRRVRPVDLVLGASVLRPAGR